MRENLLKQVIEAKIKSGKAPSFEEQKAFVKEAFGVSSPFALQAENIISEKQIEILEEAIRRYERLEDIRKFTKLAVSDIETVTEEDINRALEVENMVSIEDEKAVLALIQNEGFLKDLTEKDFTEILAQNPFSDSSYPDLTLNSEAEKSHDYFDDFDL